jgi:hypothetical protein
MGNFNTLLCGCLIISKQISTIRIEVDDLQRWKASFDSAKQAPLNTTDVYPSTVRAVYFKIVVEAGSKQYSNFWTN